MTATSVPAPTSTTAAGTAGAGGATATGRFRSTALPDRFMRRLLGVRTVTTGSSAGAHRAFRVSVVFSGIRCLITYLVIPIAVPLLSFAGVLAAPIGIVLCIIAVVNGIHSVRRFWISEHRMKWLYTWFMAFVFLVLGVALYADISRLIG